MDQVGHQASEYLARPTVVSDDPVEGFGFASLGGNQPATGSSGQAGNEQTVIHRSMGEAHHGYGYSSPLPTPEHVSFCVQKQFNLLYLKRILTKVLHGRYGACVPVRVSERLGRLHPARVVSPRLQQGVGK